MTSTVQLEDTVERPGWRTLHRCKEEPCKGLCQHWEAQWQEFLRGLNSPHTVWGKEPGPWEDAKAFLASFEQVAEACQWPKEEWVARLLPALSGEAQRAFGGLEARDREDYGKVKAAILRGEANRMETLRQHFRQFRFRDVEDPRWIYSQLQELCCRWLRPERHSKEQILELLILEQFLAILPPELQSWIRAGGPENCTQAATLAEDFLLSHQGEAKTRKWQGPLQELCLGSLDAEMKPPDPGQRRTYKDAKQSSRRADSLPGSGLKCPSLSCSLLPPEAQETAKGEHAEAPENLKETGMSSDVVEETLTQPKRGTIFWRVLQEDSRNADTLEGCLVRKPDLTPQSEKVEEMAGQYLEERERLSGRDSGDQNRRRVKAENSPCGRKESEVTPGLDPEVTQGDLLVPHEIHKETCESIMGLQKKDDLRIRGGCFGGEEKRSRVKVEESQEGEMCPEEAHGTLAEVTQWNLPGTPGIHKRHESSWQQKPLAEQENEDGQQSDGISRTSPVHAERKKLLFSKYGRKYRYKSGLVMVHTGENSFECPTLGENIPQHQRFHTGERRYELSEYGKRDGLIGHTTERPYQCYECGKSFNCQTSLDSHQGVHTEGRPYECSQCGKRFRHRQTLLKHQKIHTGEKLHKCPECGKVFTSKGELMRHQRIHTGEKPYKCPQCGKSFRQRVHLISHHRTHTGEKPFMCLECGKNLHRRNKLIIHLETHRAQEHYECPECGKSFSQKATLMNHQSTHVGH
ncbi:PREDICTED: zinc finger protein with KRAB and SCAN domains 7-like [Gekko japonicus]|uniref:Zinc finger protein with KRAB and SCAN domains 7-like n=1 Tax=Gekko japonicus TaxID=146911 RepID=A0ABM1JLB2_GEKJA|nr:PREDICTED: zinc finger protein with KRAB and SCAN domains 7-like [Gekko japonicus]